ncbi:MAG: hypothetical protein E7337_04020 [Clostridiales bacterium]|nr:hypothetical protein [Clostridiales bacterium]
MKTNTRKLALCGVMCALAVVIMLLGGVVTIATFCCPALAGLVLIPLVVECGKRMALGAWVAISLLSLMLCPNKEAALLFTFLGYYPVVKWQLDTIKHKWKRRGLKILILNASIAVMYSLIFYVLRIDQIMADYQDVTQVTFVLMVLLGNLTLYLYDRMLFIGAWLYIKKYRAKLFGQHD